MANKEIISVEIITKVCNAVKLGMSIGRAATYAGISRQSYYDWRKLGKEKPDSMYGLFLENIRKAESEAEIKLLIDIQKDEAWQSKAWILERRFPNEWGRKDALSVKAIPFRDKIARDASLDMRNLSIEDLQALKAIQERAMQPKLESTEEKETNIISNPMDELFDEPK